MHRALSWCSLLTVMFVLFACDTDKSPTSPAQQDEPQPTRLRTAADTAAFLAKRGKGYRADEHTVSKVAPRPSMFVGAGDCRGGTLGGYNAGITLCPGDTLTVTVISAECAGINDTMSVSGPVEFILSIDACREVGETRTGVASVQGVVQFKMVDPCCGSGSWITSGTYPELTVGMEEGFGDLDYDDNVLSVHVGRRPCPPTGNPVLDDPTNRERFDSSFKASSGGDPMLPQNDRREHIRVGYKYPDGHVESVDLNPPSATNCDIPQLFVPLTNGDGKIAWIWHSHPFFAGELVPQCGNIVYQYVKPYPATPSRPDWKLLDDVNQALFNNGEPPIDGYIWDMSQSMWMKHNPISGHRPDDWEHFDRESCQH